MLIRCAVFVLVFVGTWSSSPPSLAHATTDDDVARFAVIGDYGDGTSQSRAVAALVKSWNPDFIITTGDNNYPNGAASTIEQHVGELYREFIRPADATVTTRFFPSLGNHDWRAAGAGPYLDYFTLPGNERYYDFVWGPAHLFAVDSDPHEPDGVERDSRQAQWLQDRLASSTACWQIVYFHHPPFSSGPHGPYAWMQWPFTEWGADAVLAGHDHTYERLLHAGLPYFVNGLGGGNLYDFRTPVPGSEVRYNASSGAMRVTATSQAITYEFVAVDGTVVDTYAQEGCDRPLMSVDAPATSATLASAGDASSAVVLLLLLGMGTVGLVVGRARAGRRHEGG